MRPTKEDRSEVELQKALKVNAQLVRRLAETVGALKMATRELECSGLAFDHPLIVRLNRAMATAEEDNAITMPLAPRPWLKHAINGKDE